MTTYSQVIIFELFMPLSNEAALRSALDALFYRDTVLTRLEQIEPEIIRNVFSESLRESEQADFSGIADWVGQKFTGYSISHTQGRFRAWQLLTLREAYGLIENEQEYLIDETTAVVRFILPCSGVSTDIAEFTSLTSSKPETVQKFQNPSIKREAEQLRFCFEQLIMQEILKIVKDEEVWLLESGLQTTLHIWKKQD